MAVTPNYGFTLVDDTMFVAPLENLFNTFINALDAALYAALAPLRMFLLTGTVPGVVPAGTPAQRDSAVTGWGTPVTAADRVALSNKGARWMNVNTGYIERYYCATSDASAQGRNAALTAGWYPFDGDIPALSFNRVAVLTTTSGAAALHINPSTTLLQQGNMAHTTGTVTIPIEGLYRVAGVFPFASSASGIVNVQLFVNGVAAYANSHNNYSGGGAAPTFDRILPFAAGDVIDFRVAQNSGAALDLGITALYWPYWSFVWQGVRKA